MWQVYNIHSLKVKIKMEVKNGYYKNDIKTCHNTRIS